MDSEFQIQVCSLTKLQSKNHDRPTVVIPSKIPFKVEDMESQLSSLTGEKEALEAQIREFDWP